MYRSTKCTIIDNSGALVGRIIHVPSNKKPTKLGSIVLLSIIKRNFGRRKIKLGQVFRAIVVGRGFQTKRHFGNQISNFNTAVLIKKSDVTSISKRLYGPIPLEFRKLKLFKFISMGTYIY